LKEGKSTPSKAWLFLKVGFVPQEIYPVKKF
jgi:hypothetical protein